jgi:hypothetical protein
MEEDQKGALRLKDELMAKMMEMLDTYPGIGWAYIAEAERGALNAQTQVEYLEAEPLTEEMKKRAG